uniref:Transposase n=1 Tax=Steinernema glaseri TaxID=37863 RepID=A0A1I7YG35_9BILA
MTTKREIHQTPQDNSHVLQDAEWSSRRSLITTLTWTLYIDRLAVRPSLNMLVEKNIARNHIQCGPHQAALRIAGTKTTRVSGACSGGQRRDKGQSTSSAFCVRSTSDRLG